MSNDIEKALVGLYKDDYPEVVRYIEFLKSKRMVMDGDLYEYNPNTRCWSMVDKEMGRKRFQKLLEEMQDTPRTGPVEHHWTREELHERG